MMYVDQDMRGILSSAQRGLVTTRWHLPPPSQSCVQRVEK